MEDQQGILCSSELKAGQGNDLIPCFRCGICCIGPRIQLTLVEARRISDNLGIPWQEFEDIYIDPLWLGGNRFLLRQSNGECVFLKHEEGRYKSSCMIHEFRPFSCISWTPSLFRKQCQEGLTKYWGLELSPSLKLLGPEEMTRDFYSLLESIVPRESPYTE